MVWSTPFIGRLDVPWASHGVPKRSMAGPTVSHDVPWCTVASVPRQHKGIPTREREPLRRLSNSNRNRSDQDDFDSRVPCEQPKKQSQAVSVRGLRLESLPHEPQIQWYAEMPLRPGFLPVEPGIIMR